MYINGLLLWLFFPSRIIPHTIFRYTKYLSDLQKKILIETSQNINQHTLSDKKYCKRNQLMSTNKVSHFRFFFLLWKFNKNYLSDLCTSIKVSLKIILNKFVLTNNTYIQPCSKIQTVSFFLVCFTKKKKKSWLNTFFCVSVLAPKFFIVIYKLWIRYTTHTGYL